MDEAVAGLKRNHDKAVGQAKKARDELDSLKAEQDALQETVRDLQAKANAQAAGVSDDKLAELTAKIEADTERKWSKVAEARDEATAKLSAAEARISEMLLDNVVKEQIAQGGAKAERVGDLFRLTADRFELTDDGEPVLKGADRSTPIDKYVSETLSAEYPEWFNGSGSSGGGASKSSGGAGGVRRIAAADIAHNVDGILDGSIIVDM
jgi:hypothetical protein